MSYFTASIARTTLTIVAAIIVVTYMIFWVRFVSIGVTHFTHLPELISVVLVILGLVYLGKLGSFLMMLLGLYAAIWVIGWPWYGAIAFFFPTTALFLGYVVVDSFAELYKYLRPSKYRKRDKGY